MKPRRLSTNEAGFTLIEVLITIVIMSVITVPLGNFVLSYLVSYTQTQTRMSESHDMQIAAAYFSQDVANTGLRDSNGDATQSVWTSSFPSGYCGSTLGGTPVLLLAWDEYDWNSTTKTADTAIVHTVGYVVVSGTLQRAECLGTSSATLQSSSTLVHSLYGGAATPSCSSTCGAASPPTTITLALTLKDSASDSGTSVTVTGQRRQS